MQKKKKTDPIDYDNLPILRIRFRKRYYALYRALDKIVTTKRKYGIGRTSLSMELLEMALRGLSQHLETHHIANKILNGEYDEGGEIVDDDYVIEENENE